MARDRSPPLIRNLLRPQAYGHPVAELTLVETHISWVILTGSYVYKLKKPVDLGFVDFTTLERRRHFCQEELRLNRRLAPELYLAVVTVGGSEAEPRMEADGPALEYAVKMRQFDQDDLFSRLLPAGRLEPAHLDDLARHIARFHHQAAAAPGDSRYGHPDQVSQPVRENFRHIEQTLDDPQLPMLQDWATQEHRRLRRVFAQRKGSGRIRECHGDLHLGNIVLHQGRATAFDCIEFNPDFRWIDVMSELAFLTMDLADHEREDLAYRCLNTYLSYSGDYSGLKVLRYYQAYRAMVRAKVDAIRLRQPDLDADARGAVRADYDNYVRLAVSYTRPPDPQLIITHGLSGSGKSTVARTLAEGEHMIHLRSDVERKRLFGLAPEARSDSSLGGGLYSPEATRQTYRRLAELAEEVLAAGYAVIVDAAFLKAWQREPFQALAQRRGVMFTIVHCQADETTLRQRIQTRAAAGADPSEASVAVLQHQLETQEAFSGLERRAVVTVDTQSGELLQELTRARTSRRKPATSRA